MLNILNNFNFALFFKLTIPTFRHVKVFDQCIDVLYQNLFSLGSNRIFPNSPKCLRIGQGTIKTKES